MEGRHVHPSTLYPGGVGTVATIQLMTDYLTRLMRYVEFMKKVVPMHDDLFDFFYEALPGYEQVGLRRTLLGCWGSFQDPAVCNFDYKDMTKWGRADVRHPGRRGRRQAGHQRPGRHQPGHPDPARLVVLRRLGRPGDVRDQGPAGQPGGPPAPLEPAHQPASAEAGHGRQVQLGDEPALVRRQDHLALDTGGGPIARLWATALAGLVDAGGYVKATGHSVQINLPKTALKGPVSFEWKIPQWSNTIERGRARTYFQAYAAACALHFAEKALEEIRAGRTKTWEKFEVPG